MEKEDFKRRILVSPPEIMGPDLALECLRLPVVSSEVRQNGSHSGTIPEYNMLFFFNNKKKIIPIYFYYLDLKTI